jgi:hypothetical protein
MFKFYALTLCISEWLVGWLRDSYSQPISWLVCWFG